MTMGMSVAASWAWGTSMVLGMDIARNKGLGAFLIWAAANSLTLALFGWLYQSGRIPARIYKMRAVRFGGIVIQCFCLIIQMNVISNTLQGVGVSSGLAYAFAAASGIACVAIMARGGLRMSVLTDAVQWVVLCACVASIIAICVFGGAPRIAFPSTNTTDALWGVWSAIILLCAPIGDVQHWQRAKAMRGHAYAVGAGLFAVYLCGVLGMAMFEHGRAASIVLLIAVLCVTLSTVDSVAVALHEAGNKRVAVGIGVVLCMFWGVFARMGVLELWSKFGVFRVAFAVGILCLSYLHLRKGNRKDEHQTIET